MAENAGVPSVTVAIEGFTTQARSVAQVSGYPNLRIVTYPGIIQTHEPARIRENVANNLADQVIKALTEPVKKAGAPGSEVGDREIVFQGNLDEVNDFFEMNAWSDGLPFIPPTIQKVEEFLKFTDRAPDEVLGILPPRNGRATVWKIAVNGVMAGCRPQYMPILVAIVEVMSDPDFGLEHAGSTPGWESMILLNGPIRDELGFNYKAGVQRPGNRANTSIGRFYRMFLRNVAGLLPGSTDMGTFGHMFRAVVPENDEACREIGWKPLHVQRGFQAENSVVTITSARAISDPLSTAGEKPERHLDYIVDWVKRLIEPYEASLQYEETHVILMTPTIASILAKGGYSKEDVNRYILEQATIPARQFEWSMTVGPYQPPGTTLHDLVRKNILPKEYALSGDPERQVPLLVSSRGQFLIVVTGDPTRNRSCVYRQNFMQGYATSKKIQLPAQWKKLLKETREK